MTHPTDEELDALVKRLTWHREHPVTGKLVYANEDGPDAADALTALRAQLTEVRAERDNANKIMDDWTTLHRVIADIRDASGLGSRPMLSELASKIGKRIADANARADKAEAALAAQIEADAAKYGPRANEGLLPNLGLQLGDQVVRVTGHDKWSDPDIGSEYTFCINSDYRKGAPHLVKDGSGWTTMNEKGTFRVIGRKPHDRTALDRLLADAEAKALRRAAYIAANACLVPPDGGNPTEAERLVCDEACNRILAMIPKEGA